MYHMPAYARGHWLMFRRKDEAETILITKQVVLHSTSASLVGHRANGKGPRRARIGLEE
jgi:hypothetical protein